MTQEKWEELVEQITKMAKVTRHGTKPLTKEIKTAEGTEVVEDGSIEELEFEGPAGRMMLTRWVRPKVEEVKVFSHRRVEGATLQVKRSETEMVATENLYKWDETLEEWEEMDIGKITKQPNTK